jgi:hypothetical protein
MAEIVQQGEVNILGTTLYTGSHGIILTKITTLRFYNPLAYVLTLERYDATTATSETLYELTLGAGDTVTDDLTYALKEGDKLVVYSDIPGTTYYIYGLDYANS